MFFQSYEISICIFDEQPSQLKSLEWPSFHSTLKTATLTLVLVALLIVALSTADPVLLLSSGVGSWKKTMIW